MMGKSSRLAGAHRVFCLGMLAHLLTFPCDSRVGAVTFTYSGFEENLFHLVSNSSWVFNSTTGCFHFDPAEFNIFYSASGRLLYPFAVPMIEPGVTRPTTVRSFSTSFIYQLRILSELGYTGPGMAFIMVPDNVTLGAPGTFGVITEETFETAKNYGSDNHTVAVEMDTYMNPGVNDTNNNHIGINLASMNSTYSWKPVYFMASIETILYQQIWIDYFEADSRMDIYYANYKQAKPLKPQGTQSGLDLSLLKENMFIGFATAKGIESTNIAYVCAWSFSNDGIPAPSIVMAQDATIGGAAPPPPANGPPIAPPSRPPPAPMVPSLSPPPVPSQERNNEPPPTSENQGGKQKSNLGIPVGVSISVLITVVGLTMCITVFACWRRFLSHGPLRIFISHAGGLDGSKKNFPTWLQDTMRNYTWSVGKSHVKIFFDEKDIEFGTPFAEAIIQELERFDIGIVVVTDAFFETKWPMTELIALVEAQEKRKKRIRVLPLFYELSPEQVKAHLKGETWEGDWEVMSQGNHPLSVKTCREAVKRLCDQRGIPYRSKKRDQDEAYIATICTIVNAILCKERSFASYLIRNVKTAFRMNSHH